MLLVLGAEDEGEVWAFSCMVLVSLPGKRYKEG